MKLERKMVEQSSSRTAENGETRDVVMKGMGAV